MQAVHLRLLRPVVLWSDTGISTRELGREGLQRKTELVNGRAAKTLGAARTADRRARAKAPRGTNMACQWGRAVLTLAVVWGSIRELSEQK